MRLEKLINSVNYDWEIKYISNKQPNLVELKESEMNFKDLPMMGMQKSEDYIILAGLKHQPDWITKIRCLANETQSNIDSFSDWVELEIRTGDKCTK